MSEGDATMYAAQDIEQLLRCPVCLDRLTNPRLLPCQHTFCTTPCLARLAENVEFMKCPECRMESFIPLDGVLGYPVNRTIQSFLDLQTQGGAVGCSSEGGATVDKCQICDQQGDLGRCRHCSKFLCGDCKKTHCDQMKHDIGKSVNQVRRTLPKISDSIRDVEQKIIHVKQSHDQVKSEITTAVERAIKELRDREKLLHSEVDSFALGELRHLRLHQENFEVELASISSFCDSTEGAITRNQATSDKDLVLLNKQCRDHLQSLQNFGSSWQLAESRNIRFSCDPPSLHSTIFRFGELDAAMSNSSTSHSPSLQSNMSVPSRSPTYRSAMRPGLIHYATPVSSSESGVYRSPETFMVSFPNSGARRNPLPVNNTVPTQSVRTSRRELTSGDENSGQASHSSLGSSSVNNNNNSGDGIGGGLLNVPASTTGHIATTPQPVATGTRNRTFVRDPNSLNSDVSHPSVAQNGVSFDVALNETLGDFSIDDELANLTNTNTVTFRYSMGDSIVLQQALNNYHQKGRIIKKMGSRGSENGRFTWPRGVAVSPVNDSIAVADSSNHRVQLFDCHYLFIKSFGSYGQGPGEFDCLAGIAINHLGQIIVADRYNHRIQIFDRYGEYMLQFGEEGVGDGQLSYPWGVSCDDMGFIYVCDKDNHRVQVFQLDGTFVRKFGSLGNRDGQFENPHYLAVSSDRRILVSDNSNHRIQIFDMYGRHQLTFGHVGTRSGQLKYPRGIAVDHQGFIIVADSGNNRIQVFRSDGRFHTSFGCWGSGDGQLKGLEGIALTSNGTIVVSDRENHRLQVF